jgi:hypothetical protein
MKTITCLECGYQMSVPAHQYTYPRCPHCQIRSFECTATGGCPRCAGLPDAAFEVEPDTCDGFVSQGPFCCTCDFCAAASEPHEPSEVQAQPFWRILSWWSRLTQRI